MRFKNSKESVMKLRRILLSPRVVAPFRFFLFAFLPICLLGFVISSCSYLQPSPIPNSSFLSDVPGELKEHADSRAPFQRTWAKKEALKELVGIPGVTIRNIKVTTDYLNPSTRVRLKTFELIKKDAEEIAGIFRERLVKALEEFPKPTAILDENSFVDEKTLDIELAIVELVPQAVARKVLGAGFGFFTVFGSLIGSYGDSVMAVEGKLIRSHDGEILAAFADRHSGKISPIDLRIISQYHQAEENIREWSEDIAELLNTPATHQVTGESIITLLPW